MMSKGLLVGAILSVLAVHAEQAPSRIYLICRTAKENPLGYKVGEKVHFDFTLTGEDVPSNETFSVRWAMIPDGGATRVGTNLISAAKGFRIETVRTSPGFVFLQAGLATKDGKRVLREKGSPAARSLGEAVNFYGSAGVEVEKLHPAEPEPDDFDAFWAKAKQDLAAVPMNPKLEEVPDDRDKVTRCYRVEVGCLGPRPVTGFLTVPRRCSEDASYKVPIVVTFDGAGCHPPEKRERGPGDAIRFHVNAHGVPLGRDAAFYREWFAPLKGGVDGPRYTGRYVYDEKANSDPRTSYMFGMAMRVVRAVEFARTLKEWNGFDVKVTGGSQGGLQTMWAAALADGVTRAEPWITWSCDLGGFKVKRFSAGSWRIPYAKGIFYYDPVFMARRIPKTCYLDITRVGLGDNVAPPSGIMISYNECPGSKRIRLVQGSVHGGQMVPGDRQVAVFSKGPVHEFPETPWEEARVTRDAKGKVRVVSETGKVLLELSVNPGELAPLVKVTVDEDGMTVDTCEAKRAAKGREVTVVAMGSRFSAPELPGEECRCRLALSSDDNMAKVRSWIIGDRIDGNGKRQWMAFGPSGGPYLRVSKSERAEYDVPYDGCMMPENSTNYRWRFDFREADAPVKFYGARIAPYADLPVAKPVVRKVEPKLVFHVSFDKDSPEADFAAGAKAPRTAKGLAYEAGRNGGRAVRLSPTAKSALAYPAADNLMSARGTVAIWYRSCGKAASGLGPFLFAAGCPFNARMGTGFPYFWFWQDTLRVDFSSDNDGYQMCGIGISDPHWHHVVMAWNEYGRTFWVDGQPAPGNVGPISSALAFQDRVTYSRARLAETFAIGGQVDGAQPFDCLVDDVRIFSDALTDSQVRALWKRDGGTPPPPPDYKAVLPSANRYEGGFAKVPGRIDADDLELLEEIRLDRIPTAGEFRAVGKLAVKELAGVKYLEVENAEKTRFAVGLHLTESPLHYIEIDYPDDCARTMEFIVQPTKNPGTDYTMQVGVLTGRDVAGAGTSPTGRILTHRFPLWTRDPHVALIAMSWHKEEAGAAIAAIRAYRVKSGRLPQARIVEPEGAPKRQFGIHFEDCPLGQCFAAPNDGRDVPGFIDGVERLAAAMKFTGQNLFSFPVSWYRGVNDPSLRARHPPHFADGLMTVFDREGLGFMASINTYALPIPPGLITSDSLRDGSLHASFLSMPDKGHVGSNHSRYNIAHPETQRLVAGIVDDLIAEGVRHPSFRGITLHIHSGFVGWFGSSHAGYNDYCIDAFEKRWGVKVPVDRTDPARAGKYAAWLRANAWEKWRSWRCETAGAFWIAQAKKLKAARSDLRLWFNFMTCCGATREHFMKEDYARQVHLDGGLDPKILSKVCDNVIFAEGFCPADARHGIQRTLYDLAPNARRHLEERWQQPGFYSALNGAPGRWSHQHDRYWESNIGDSRVRGPEGSKPLSCEWMTEHNWRVATLNPPDRDALKHFVLPLRFNDLDGMTKGGFLIGTYGMEEFLVPFAQAFRSLPAVPFDTVSDKDGVVVRHKALNGVDWSYVVNTTGEPRTATVDLPSVGRVTLSLEPWELKSYNTK